MWNLIWFSCKPPTDLRLPVETSRIHVRASVCTVCPISQRQRTDATLNSPTVYWACGPKVNKSRINMCSLWTTDLFNLWLGRSQNTNNSYWKELNWVRFHRLKLGMERSRTLCFITCVAQDKSKNNVVNYCLNHKWKTLRVHLFFISPLFNLVG